MLILYKFGDNLIMIIKIKRNFIKYFKRYFILIFFGVFFHTFCYAVDDFNVFFNINKFCKKIENNVNCVFNYNYHYSDHNYGVLIGILRSNKIGKEIIIHDKIAYEIHEIVESKYSNFYDYYRIKSSTNKFDFSFKVSSGIQNISQIKIYATSDPFFYKRLENININLGVFFGIEISYLIVSLILFFSVKDLFFFFVFAKQIFLFIFYLLFNDNIFIEYIKQYIYFINPIFLALILVITFKIFFIFRFFGLKNKFHLMVGIYSSLLLYLSFTFNGQMRISNLEVFVWVLLLYLCLVFFSIYRYKIGDKLAIFIFIDNLVDILIICYFMFYDFSNLESFRSYYIINFIFYLSDSFFLIIDVIKKIISTKKELFNLSYNNLLYKKYLNDVRYSTMRSYIKKLKYELNPHFLYNIFNSIISLGDQNVKKAQDSLQSLLFILKNLLEYTKNETVTLFDELEFVKKYLELEKLRFDERLLVIYNISKDIELKNAYIPPLVLQLLAENAVKHGISKLIDGGTIELEIKKVDNEALYIMMKNSCLPKKSDENKEITESTSTGLENIKTRLEIIYGQNFSKFHFYIKDGAACASFYIKGNLKGVTKNLIQV